MTLADVSTGLGAVILVLAAIGAALGGAGFFMAVLSEFRYKLVQADRELALRRLGRSIETQAHWFSEDVFAQEALAELGHQIHLSGNFDINSVRHHARLKRKKP